MGNNFGTASAAINVSKKVIENGYDGGPRETWSAFYTVDGTTCELMLSRNFDINGNVTNAAFMVSDSVHIPTAVLLLVVRRIGTNFLARGFFQCCANFESIMWRKANWTVDESGGFTHTIVYLYGRNESRGGLVVEEWKKNRRDEHFNAATFAHYFANSSGTALNRTDTDIGLSVMTKFQASNGNLVMTVEGPEQHPASALFYMFEEVHRTGIWKPTMCPHCARNRRGGMFWQSDSEDSDGAPILPLRRSRQSSVEIARGGVYYGYIN